MGLKKKVFGMVAAAALTLSMFGGVAAQNPNAAVTGSVTVNGTICGITMSASNTDFGVWKWNHAANAYLRDSGNNESFISGEITGWKPNGKCNVTVTSTGLKRTGGTEIIPRESFEVDLDGFGTTATWVPFPGTGSSAGTATFPNLDPGAGSLGLRLMSVPNTFAPGTYTGTVTIGVANGQ